jgi:hypothetical protein
MKQIYRQYKAYRLAQSAKGETAIPADDLERAFVRPCRWAAGTRQRSCPTGNI